MLVSLPHSSGGHEDENKEMDCLPLNCEENANMNTLKENGIGECDKRENGNLTEAYISRENTHVNTLKMMT